MMGLPLLRFLTRYSRQLAPPTDRGFAVAPVGGCECTVELEDGGGAKMRVHVQGIPSPDLAALSRSFWNPGP